MDRRRVRASRAFALCLSAFLLVLASATPPVAAPDASAAGEAAWSPAFAAPGVLGAVSCLASYGDKLVVGGSFDHAGPVPARGIALWDESGWHALGDMSAFGERPNVRAATAFRGGLVAVGHSWPPGGVRNVIAAFWDGSTWTMLHDTPRDDDSYIRAAIPYGGDLVVAGRFRNLGGVACNNIARWDGTAWHPMGDGTAGNSGEVAALAVYDGELIAAGDFSRAGGVSTSRIAAWTGSGWKPVGFGLIGFVETLAVFGDELYAGGWIDYAGGLPARRIARWDGSRWSTLGSGIGETSLSDPVLALGSIPGALLVGGSFAEAGGVAVSDLALWNGFEWAAPARGVQGDPDGYSYISAIHVHRGEVYVGGSFITAGLVRAHNIARLEPDESWSSLGGGQSIHGAVAALSPHASGVVAGGFFDWAGTTRAQNVAHWDGTRWSALGAGFDEPVLSLAGLDFGLVAGGRFSRSDQVVLRHVALWSENEWHAMGDGLNSTVNAVADYSGKVVAGGDFTASGMRPMMGIAAFDGTQWHSMGEIPGTARALVRCLAVDGDHLYAGGWGFKEDGPFFDFVARWNGIQWQAFEQPPPGPVLGVAILHGKVVIGIATPSLPTLVDAVWWWDRDHWMPLGSLSGGSATSLVVRGGQLYATTADRESRQGNLWAWDGATWAELGPGFTGGVPSAAIAAGNGVFVGGSFSRIGSRPSGAMAFWNESLVPVAIEDFAATSFDTGLRLEWRCSPDAVAELRDLRVERAGGAATTFTALSSALAPAARMTFEDASVEANVAYTYRLVVRDRAGVESLGAAIETQWAAPGAASIWLGPPHVPAGEAPVVFRYSAGRRGGDLTLALYDVRGRLVRQLAHGLAAPGVHARAWDRRDGTGRPVVRGVYFVRMETAGMARTRRVPLLGR